MKQQEIEKTITHIIRIRITTITTNPIFLILAMCVEKITLLLMKWLIWTQAHHRQCHCR
jgi:hypothetical protein